MAGALAATHQFQPAQGNSSAPDRRPRTGSARRILNGVFHETLLSLNDVDRELKYSIDDCHGPVAKDQVSSYVGIVRVFPVTDGNATFVGWSSSWQDSKGGVKEFCDPIYSALLGSLQTHFAAR